MTREADIATLLKADATLMAILTGGVYTETEVGIQGFRRGADSPTDAAFDPVEGTLLPCAVIRPASEMGLDAIRMPKDRISGTAQTIEIYFYEYRGKDNIIAARERTYSLLEQAKLPSTFPLMWIGDSAIFYDTGPVQNATTTRQDWRAVFLRRPV